MLDYSKLVPHITTAVDWFSSHIEHPKGTFITHHGIHLCDSPLDRVNLQVCTCASVLTSKWILLIFDIPSKNLEYSREECLNPWTEEEISNIMEAVKSAGLGVHSTWNGKDCTTFSVLLTHTAHESALGLVGNYHKGCPDHGGSVFCPKGCEWYRSNLCKNLPEGWAA